MAELAERIKLPFAVISSALDLLRRDRYLEVKGGSGYAATTYTFKTTEAGKTYGTELLHLCHYVGPAPVTLDDYQAMVRRQTVKSILIPEEDIPYALTVGGQIISIFDPVSHTPAEPEHPATPFDQRWEPELTKENLEAAWSCYYVQMNN
jgi:hypothetical protein